MRKTHFVCALAVLAILAFTACAYAFEVGENAPGFDLKDQFGKEWKLSNLKGSVVVVVTANPDSGRLMGPWVDNLKSRYGSKIQILSLMDLHTVPGIGRGIARSRIKRETKDPVMIDFNGGTAKSYLVSGKYPVVTVIDKNCVIKDIQKSSYSKDGFSSVVHAIDKALK